jgi:hypothetical protein
MWGEAVVVLFRHKPTILLYPELLHISVAYCFKIHFNNILQSTLKYPTWKPVLKLYPLLKF